MNWINQRQWWYKPPRPSVTNEKVLWDWCLDVFKGSLQGGRITDSIATTKLWVLSQDVPAKKGSPHQPLTTWNQCLKHFMVVTYSRRKCGKDYCSGKVSWVGITKFCTWCQTSKAFHSLSLTMNESAQTSHHPQNFLGYVLKKEFYVFHQHL